MKISRFEDLECWQQARVLVRKIYEVTKGYPFNKDLRLSGQIQAAGTSVMSNIPEGFIRRSDKEFVQFLFIAMSSSAEVQSQLYVALDQGYINHKQFDEIYGQAEKTAMLISGLIKYLRTKSAKQTKSTGKTKQTE
jgi:four helix bundle protein